MIVLKFWNSSYPRLDPAQVAAGNIYGVQTEAKLSSEQMMDIARSRYSGVQPIRPSVGRWVFVSQKYFEKYKVLIYGEQ